MRLGTRGSPPWPELVPETGYVEADRPSQDVNTACRRGGPYVDAGGALVGADDAVDDQVLEVGIIRHRLEDAPPHAFVAPAAEATEHAAPLAEDLRKVAPR
jgi:hypothetical protein